MPQFDYNLAFSRNLGWVTEEEQKRLKSARIAIAGMGGVGGVHLLTLARLGVENFRIADFDQFELANFNRQIGATVSSIGKPKTEILKNMALDINPNINIEVYDQGINEDNLESFLSGSDVYLDGLDFFCIPIRELLFPLARKMNIPVTTVGPVGMGAALMNFLPGKMTFDQYFGLSSTNDPEEKAIRFLAGLSLSGIHQKYLADYSKVDFKNKKAPSTMMGCQLSSGIAATEILKIILKRGPVLAAPYNIQFDAYLNRTVVKKLWFGYKNPLHQIKLYIIRKILLK
ncbi:MAG: ThiF family adenylyltransferase [Bdellovibrionales bacterium]|nr:ThiF family adenylyltransferase [Bdellovibrionales bacterium]